MIVLDTQALVWWVSDPKRLSKTACQVIEKAVSGEGACVSCISSWELAMLSRRGRLELTMDVAEWLARVEALPFFRFFPVDSELAVKAVHLPEPLHRNPADRIIVATALKLGASLVTADEKLRQYPHVRTVW